MSMVTEQLLIFDGNNFCIRNAGGFGFKAQGNFLTTSEGVPTGMLLGSINSFIATCARFEPDNVIFTFDWGRSSYRQSIRSTYKSNRKAERDPVVKNDLRPQFDMFQQFLDVIGVPWIRSHNVEADDLIASMVRIAEPYPVLIVSADHDLLQLVSDSTHVLRPAIGKTPEVIYTVEQVVAKYGLTPEQLPAMWALMGDSGDGIDGIPKVGPVTATKLLKESGTLEGVVGSESKYGQYRDLVMDNEKMIRLGHDQFDALIPLDLDVGFAPIYSEELRAFLSHYELNSLLQKFDRNSLWGPSDTYQIGHW